MGISQYIKEIGRGKDGARSLTREQAADLMGRVLDGTVSDLEIGAFCLAMRIKGETPEEMAGFLDATHARVSRLPDNGQTTVVLPSYNGARGLAGVRLRQCHRRQARQQRSGVGRAGHPLTQPPSPCPNALLFP